MDHTFVDEKSLKSLEDYAVFLTSNMISLMTLQNIEVRAIEIGIMKEDQAERSNTMVWDLRRLMKLYQNQLESVLELLPDDFNAMPIIHRLKEKERDKACAMIRKPKVEKCDT